MKYEVLEVDAWGNEEGGYDFNAAYATGLFIDITEDDDELAIKEKLSSYYSCSNLDLEDESETVFTFYDDNFKPILQLQACI